MNLQETQEAIFKFGAQVLEQTKERCANGEMDETDEEIMQLALEHGLVRQVEYNREKHGDNIALNCGVEEGDLIYYWGEDEAVDVS